MTYGITILKGANVLAATEWQIFGYVFLGLLIVADALIVFIDNKRTVKIIGVIAAACLTIYLVCDIAHDREVDKARADRELSYSQLAAIKPLAKYAGQPFVVRAEWNDPEACKFARNITAVLIRECRWTGQTKFVESIGKPGPGIFAAVGKKEIESVMAAKSLTRPAGAVASELAHTLEDAGVYTMGVELGGGSLKPDEDVPEGTVVIDVGPKRR